MLLALQGTGKVTEYLEQKVQTAYPLMDKLIEEETAPCFIEEQCMGLLTGDLKPSRYLFLSDFLKTQFPSRYARWKQQGILVYEIANLEALLISIFEDFEFGENSETDTAFKYVLLKTIQEYFHTPTIIH
ncbi:hypothetical protein [Rhizosphaericola mali]|uniref:Uncharacterized protein n=1 Tax=Rhizosphaericola mali TaxID=2545455 RepID=A0A5P2G589_9BACT|nr:hypothetical protein [Rhizosphaericola mali]QES88920.1 hypothetical protein E0W69_009705 [Rhizosphaericola mali]